MSWTPLSSPSAPPPLPRIPSLPLPPQPLSSTAVCLTGSARQFDATGPSIIHHLLINGYSDSDLFVNAPLDASAAGLWALKDAPSVAVVRIAPNFPMDMSRFDSSLLSWEPNPPYEQVLGALQPQTSADGAPWEV